MFGYIPTKNLYIIELSYIKDIEYSFDEKLITTDGNKKRYTYATKNDEGYYIDIFTKTEYSNHYVEKGEEYITKASAILTTKKRVKKEILLEILHEELNKKQTEKNKTLEYKK